MEVFEDGVPPRFRLRPETGSSLAAHSSVIETMRPEGTSQQFSMIERGGYLESVEEIPDPHSKTGADTKARLGASFIVETKAPDN